MELHEPPSTGFHSKLARAILVFASIDLIRLVREMLETWRDADITYLRIMASDMVLAALALPAAVTLLRQARCGSTFVASVAAAMLVPTIAFGSFFFPEFLQMWDVPRSSGNSYYLKLLLPWMLFDVLRILFWPYVFWRLHRQGIRENAVRRIWIATALSLLLCGALVGTVFLLH